MVHSANHNGKQVALKVSNDLLSGKELAVFLTKVKTILNLCVMQTFEAEVAILIKCRHANIVEYLGRFQSSKEGQVGYLCELADMGSLDSYLANSKREMSGAFESVVIQASFHHELLQDRMC